MKIAILGYGLEGKAAERYFRELYPDATLEIFDDKLAETKIDFGQEDFSDFDFVVRTPSISPYLLRSAQKVTSNTIEFFAKCPCKIIGITGTKGKSTTSALIAAIMEEAVKTANEKKPLAFPRKVFLVGNIGAPALDVLQEIKKDDVVVYEMSSYQLWDLKQSPEVAVMTPIAPDHLDVHRDLEDYLESKKNIFRYQKEGDTLIRYGENPGSDTSMLQLRGKHNHENALSAIAAARAYNARFLGLEDADFEEAVDRALANFKGLPHRLEFVRVLGGVKFFDDNFSSASPALEVAMKSFDEPMAVIAGGFDRHLGNHQEIAESIKRAKDLRFVALIGQTAPKIALYLGDESPLALAKDKYKIFGNLPDAVAACFEAVKESGGVVVMSPGTPSFDMFKNFQDRGEQYQKIVNALAPANQPQDSLAPPSSIASALGEGTSPSCPTGNSPHILRRQIDDCALGKALFLAYVLSGISYYKAFPSRHVRLMEGVELLPAQVKLFDAAYQEGLGQFAYENKLTRADLAHFGERAAPSEQAFGFDGYDFNGKTAAFRYSVGDLRFTESVEFAEADLRPKVISMQSGGKDSLLLATMLKEQGVNFAPWFVRSGEHHPKVLDKLDNLLLATRKIDREGLAAAAEKGGKNGHIPITYVLQSLALVQAVLLGAKTVLGAIGDEGTEPHSVLPPLGKESSAGYEPPLAVNHQWSKTREAEELYAKYIKSEIGEGYKVYSPLRNTSELTIAKMFVEKCWKEFGREFSSCNVANYRQHADNRELKWCGDCPKCANSFLLFAPWLSAEQLTPLFGGQDLFAKERLYHTFKGLLGIDGVEKPFECVGSVEELRTAYHLSHPEEDGDYADLPFDVPPAE
ncbi:Mur ligase family protein [Candidatus Saccharibacteria bacterium]|nr:Mur ligase family protein [Candidatus Saccharibacteria bacterium]